MKQIFAHYEPNGDGADLAEGVVKLLTYLFEGRKGKCLRAARAVSKGERYAFSWLRGRQDPAVAAIYEQIKAHVFDAAEIVGEDGEHCWRRKTEGLICLNCGKKWK